MNAPEVTWMFIRVITVICILYDLFMIFMYGVDASISHVLAKKSTEHPSIIFAGGLLCGHLFLPLFGK